MRNFPTKEGDNHAIDNADRRPFRGGADVLRGHDHMILSGGFTNIIFLVYYLAAILVS